MKRDTSEVIAAIVAEMREAQNGYSGHHASGTFRRLADRLEATLPAAEPADAGRDAVAWMMTADGYGRPAEFYRDKPAFVPPTSKLIPLYTRPPSEAAAQPIMCGCHDETQRRLCVMRDKCCRPEASSQPARSQG